MLLISIHIEGSAMTHLEGFLQKVFDLLLLKALGT